jgi:uncharacterized protein with GYD domain
MSKYILLLNWTDQGIKAIKDSGKRFDAARELARKCGCTMESIYMTFGPYDQVAIVEAPDDESVALFGLRTAALGNVRATTLRAFEEGAYRQITGNV